MTRTTIRACALALLAVLHAPAWAVEANSAVKVTPVLKTGQSWDGATLHYPQGPAEVTGMLIEIAPGGETGWHLHPVPSFGMVLEGELAVHLKSGAVKVVKPGEAIAEVVNTLHNGRNLGTVPVKILVFYAGTAGQPTTARPPQP